MGSRGLGLILLWLGTVLLVAVLQHRLRRGAWSEEAFEAPPPIERWSLTLAASGMVLAGVGIVLTVGSFW